MNLINLINREAPGVPYTLTTFPDGEPHIVLGEINRKYAAHVVCRIANPNDLFVLLQVGNILNRQGVPFSLTIRYLIVRLNGTPCLLRIFPTCNSTKRSLGLAILHTTCAAYFLLISPSTI